MAYGRNVDVKKTPRTPKAAQPPVAAGPFQEYVSATDAEADAVQTLIADLTARIEVLEARPETPTPPVP